MPRKPRFHLSGVPVHVVQRGNNRQPVFYDEQDYRGYLKWLEEGADRYGCAIHAYVLMTNHVHLLLSPANGESIGRLMQYLGRHYVLYINYHYGRSGTLWEGRYKASLIQAQDYLLACYRYIETNPLRAGMVKSPGEYRWSSYGDNALGGEDRLVTPHSCYLALGRRRAERMANYKALFKAHIDEGQLKEIRAAWQTGTPLGNHRFKAEVEAMLGKKVGQAKRGRPSKVADKATKGL
ncbi:MAG: transposase [Gammaproteobacteria bacterium]